jgi:hypothetical protein
MYENSSTAKKKKRKKIKVIGNIFKRRWVVIAHFSAYEGIL